MDSWQIGEKGTPWQFWEDKRRLAAVPNNKSPCQKTEICSDPISADPIRPFPTTT